jgi:hypothetical protein
VSERIERIVVQIFAYALIKIECMSFYWCGEISGGVSEKRWGRGRRWNGWREIVLFN